MPELMEQPKKEESKESTLDTLKLAMTVEFELMKQDGIPVDGDNQAVSEWIDRNAVNFREVFEKVLSDVIDNPEYSSDIQLAKMGNLKPLENAILPLISDMMPNRN